FNVLNSAIPFLLLRVLTAYLSPEPYGAEDIFYNTTLIITPISGLRLVQSVARYYFEKIVLSKFISTVLIVLLSTGLILTALSLIFSILFEQQLMAYDIPPYLIFLAFLYSLFTQLSEILLVLWRVSFKVAYFGVFRVSKTALDLGLSIFLIASLARGWGGSISTREIVAFLLAIIFL